MATEVWFKSHTSDGCQYRYYLGFSPKIPPPDVYRSYSVPVILEPTILALIVAVVMMIPATTRRTSLTGILFWNQLYIYSQQMSFIG